MSGKIKTILETEDTDMSLVEEFLNIDSSIIDMEKNKDLIRMEMNIVEFPIFSRSNTLKINQIKKYYFSTDKTSYLEIIPAHNTMIPGELEERVFIALIKILRNNGFKATFYCTMNDIFDNMKIENINTRRTLYPKVKKAISKLQSTTFKFQNLFYSNETNRVIEDLIQSSILSFRSIRIKDASSKEQKFFADKRLKEVYQITIAKQFYDNIIKKGYLTFDADILLKIKDPVSRSIFTMITKWRKNDLFLKKPAYYIARRIPLAWDNNPRRTVLRIEKSLKELGEQGYIKGYKLNRYDKWEKADFDMYFDESHNKIKREDFYDERAFADKMIHMIEDRQNEVDTSSADLFTNPQFNEILDIFPDVAKKLKTLPVVIRDALKNHEYAYVKYTAEYTALFCKASYMKYFKDALEKHWADEYIAKKEIKIKKKDQKEKKVIEDAIIVEETKETKPSVTWEEYLNLDSSLQEEIFAAAYEDFLMQSGSADNKIMRGIFKKSQKSLVLKIMETYSNITTHKVKELEIDEMKNPIEKSMNEVKVKENVKISQEYPTISSFLLQVITFINTEKLNIDIPSFVQLFNLLKEFEDNTMKASYNETTRIGEIIKK